MIIDHTNYLYRRIWSMSGKNKHNGAYYYSIEIVNNIIPKIKTERNWITVNINGVGCDDAIVFIHNNKLPERYEWLKQYKNLVLVCGVPDTCEKVAHIGKTIYLPLSVDVEYIKQFAVPEEERHGKAFVGRNSKSLYDGVKLPIGVDRLSGMPRKELLKSMAYYEYVYAVGRTAIEAKVLGCKILPYDPRFQDTEFWKVIDNSEAAEILQRELDKIDGTP